MTLKLPKWNHFSQNDSTAFPWNKNAEGTALQGDLVVSICRWRPATGQVEWNFIAFVAWVKHLKEKKGRHPHLCCLLLLSWCLMSSDVIWHIRDKLWPMPKHGSIRKVYACLAVTGHLHFWQNDRDFLRATVVTRGWNGYRNKSQHRKSTLEKKILPPFQQGFEPATFQSRVRCSNHWAIPAPCLCCNVITPFMSKPNWME